MDWPPLQLSSSSQCWVDVGFRNVGVMTSECAATLASVVRDVSADVD